MSSLGPRLSVDFDQMPDLVDHAARLGVSRSSTVWRIRRKPMLCTIVPCFPIEPDRLFISVIFSIFCGVFSAMSLYPNPAYPRLC